MYGTDLFFVELALYHIAYECARAVCTAGHRLTCLCVCACDYVSRRILYASMYEIYKQIAVCDAYVRACLLLAAIFRTFKCHIVSFIDNAVFSKCRLLTENVAIQQHQ